jgi:hypothetical protein
VRVIRKSGFGPAQPVEIKLPNFEQVGSLERYSPQVFVEQIEEYAACHKERSTCCGPVSDWPAVASPG